MRNARRRLQRILNNELYGPKLVRLNRAQERTVLDLIEAGEGKRARQAILDYDAERRAGRRRPVVDSRSHGVLARDPNLSWDRLSNAVADHIEGSVGFTGPYGKGGGTREGFLRLLNEHRYDEDMEGRLRVILSVPPHVFVERAKEDAGAHYSPYWYHTGR